MGETKTKVRILALDTSSRSHVLGLCENGHALAELSSSSRAFETDHLLPALEKLLKTADLTLADIDGFAVSLGPGSFTGLRIGLAVAKGLAWSLGKPLLGLHSLENLVHEMPESSDLLVPMIESRRGHVFAGGYRWEKGSLQTALPPRESTVSDLLRELPGPFVCLGSGARRYREEIMADRSEHAKLLSVEYDYPRGRTLARLGYDSYRQKKYLDLFATEPLYLQDSVATPREGEV